ncbi:MAG: LysM peptidoglycan-binding domain-containing protein [Chloroflexota bacterium]|jgi:LysM repeat protein
MAGDGNTMVRWLGATLTSVILMACGNVGDVSLLPRETVPALLYITPAPTLDVNATVTAYAQAIIPSPTPSGMYVIKAGDTLSAIAADFGSTVEEIMTLNNITNPETIQVGQTIIIPSLVDRTPIPAPTFGPQDTPTVLPTETPVPVTDITATPTS